MSDTYWVSSNSPTNPNSGSSYNAPITTPTESSGWTWSGVWDDLTKSGGLVDKGSKVVDFIGKVLGGEQGKGAQVAGIAGLSYLLNELGGGSGGSSDRPTGYTGGIPTYTATREQTPYSTTTTTTPEGQVVPRRPGSGGITYFKPIEYTKAADGGLMSGYPSEPVLMMNQGGIASLGGYSDGGRLLKGPGDGVSDSIPAVIGDKQPARLADGEFVIPARIVSELGNGSTEAGARKLYQMMERIQKTRKNSVGKGKVAVNSKADKHLPA